MRLKTHSWWGGCGCEWPLHIVPILQAGEFKKKSAQHNRKPKGPPPPQKKKKKKKKRGTGAQRDWDPTDTTQKSGLSLDCE